MAEGPHSQYQKALLLAALVARRHTSAHIIAFVAGPCRLGQNDIPGLISRLQGARLDIIMLASAAEVGSSTVQALQSLVDGLNGGASTAADTLPGTCPACSASQVEVSEASGRHISSKDQSSEALCELAMPSEACSRQAACEVDAASEAAWHGSEAAEKLTGRASRLVCVQPPQEGLEVWQQLEPLMELLECSDTAASRRSAPQLAEPAPASAHPNVLTVPSEGSCSDTAPRLAMTAAQQGAGLALNRPATNANAAQLWQQQNQWHRGRALLARRSGLVTPALCRNESLDLLHHLSSDGFSRPWLPNYANLPQRAAAAQQQQQQQRQLPNCNVQIVCLDVPRYQTLLELPAGRLLAPDSRGSVSQQPLQSCEGTLEGAHNAAFSAVPSTFAAHCSRPWGGAGPHTIPVAAPVQCPFDVPVTWKRGPTSAAAPTTWKGGCSSAPALDDHILRWSAHKSVPETPRSGMQPAAAHQRSPQPLLAPKALPGLKGVNRKPVAARCSSPRERAARTRACGRPVRLEADARRGKLSLVLSADERHKLKLLWTPEPAPQPVSSTPADTLVSSSSAYTSVWDRPAAPAPSAGASCHQAGASAALPPAELAVTLDPAAVSVSSTQGGRVLVVQQRLAVHKSKQRPPGEGIIGLTPEGHQVERWFFWMQQPAPAAAAIASPPAGTGTIVQADNASRIAARLQALIADVPRSSARNAFRSPMRSTEGWPHGTISLSLTANINTEASLNGHPFSFSFQTHQPSVSASSSDSTECPGHILRGSQDEDHQSVKRAPMDKTQQREANAAVAVHNTEQNSCQSCVDGSNCRECEGSPGNGLQQGLMSGGAALVTTGDACKDAVPEESVLFELD
ncbi:g4913 [Coccomyxa elongata]